MCYERIRGGWCREPHLTEHILLVHYYTIRKQTIKYHHFLKAVHLFMIYSIAVA